MRLLLVIGLLFFGLEIRAQESEKYVIVTIERESNGKLHKNETDYWIVSEKFWEMSEDNAVLPLYMFGFSSQDFKECCSSGSLILFNVTTEENFSFDADFKKSQKALVQLVTSERKEVQSVIKKWSTGYKENLKIYLTPISGKFCICSVAHKDGSAKLGYEGKIAIPVSGFIHEPTFWNSVKADQIGRFDYSELPYIALHKIQ